MYTILKGSTLKTHLSRCVKHNSLLFAVLYEQELKKVKRYYD